MSLDTECGEKINWKSRSWSNCMRGSGQTHPTLFV